VKKGPYEEKGPAYGAGMELFIEKLPGDWHSVETFVETHDP
jgi:hypothetical protein